MFAIGVAVTTGADVGDGVFSEALVDRLVPAVREVLGGTFDDDELAGTDAEEPPLLDCAVF